MTDFDNFMAEQSFDRYGDCPPDILAVLRHLDTYHDDRANGRANLSHRRTSIVAAVVDLRKAEPQVHKDTVPCISMEHLTKDEASYDSGSFPSAAMTSCDGLMVYVGDPDEWSVQARETFPNLYTVAKWAEEEGYGWVRFDSDAYPVEGLPTFDWTAEED